MNQDEQRNHEQPTQPAHPAPEGHSTGSFDYPDPE